MLCDIGHINLHDTYFACLPRLRSLDVWQGGRCDETVHVNVQSEQLDLQMQT